MDSRGEQKIIDQLRRSRLRATGQRLAIMQALDESFEHPSAEDIFNTLRKAHPTLSLSTVYKTLQVMAEMGAILTIETGIGGLRYDGHIHPHHHAICIRCGKVYDVDFDQYPVDLNRADIIPNFKIRSIKVYFSGICAVCDSLKGKPSAPPAGD
jgi:Fur family peroxide stress response transcriptional regulator